jgi:AcrR family transcriptional regulator
MAESRAAGGRPRDASVDARATAAALELVAAQGIDVMTMDAVAAHAGVSKAALYRRWKSKEVLLIEAIVTTGWNALTDETPSTGDLREDLVRIIGIESARATAAKSRILTGVLSIIGHDAALRHAITEALIEPRERAIRNALDSAVARGDIDAASDLELLSALLPALLVYRLLVRGEPVTRRWQYTVVDRLLLPAAAASSRLPSRS